MYVYMCVFMYVFVYLYTYTHMYTHGFGIILHKYVSKTVCRIQKENQHTDVLIAIHARKTMKYFIFLLRV